MSDGYEIADRLGETNPQPVALIGRIVRRIGHVEAGALLDRTLAIEAAGGMLTSDGSRRRTPGGVFFALVKQHLEASGQHEAAAALFPPRQRRPKRRAEPMPFAVALPPAPVMRPRLKGRPGAPLPAPRGLAQPAAAPIQPVLDSNSALATARRLLPAEIGCYSIGAHQESRTLRVRFAFPERARQRYAELFGALQEATGWHVELHPAPHQGRLAEAALAALPAGVEPLGGPSLRQATNTALLRVRGTMAPEQLAAVQRLFHEQTGWQLDVEQLEH
jgi:hypothetical protein